MSICSDWIGDYSGESDYFQSASVYVEVKLREVLQSTSNLELPNAFRTAVCCDLLQRMTACVGQFTSIFHPLIQELMKSVFKNYSPEVFNGIGWIHL